MSGRDTPLSLYIHLNLGDLGGGNGGTRICINNWFPFFIPLIRF